MLFRFRFLLVFSLCIPFSGVAQTTDVRREHALDTAVVIAQRVQKTVKSSSPTQSISKGEMQQRGYLFTSDALRAFSGVTLRDYGGAGGIKTVSVRGLGAAHTVVTYDGLPVADTRGGQIDLSRFRLSRLSALSLHTADQPTLLVPARSLGAATLALQADSAFSSPLYAAPLSGEATLMGGSFRTLSPSVKLSFRPSPKTRLTAAADYFFAMNDYPFTLQNDEATTREKRLNSRMNSFTAEADLYQRLPKGGSLHSKLYAFTNKRELPGPVYYYNTDNAEQLGEESLWWQTMARGTHRGGLNYFAALKLAFEKSDYTNEDPAYPNGMLRERYLTHTAYLSIGAEKQWQRFALAYSGDADLSWMRSKKPLSQRVDRLSLWQNLSLRYALPRFSLTARALFTQYADKSSDAAQRNGQTRLSPSLSLAWKMLSTPGFALFLRAHFKDLFRAPSFTENYYAHNGSTTLRPELTKQLGAGITLQWLAPQKPFSILSTLDAYANRITDKITSVPVSPYRWRTLNVGRVHALGADFTLHATLALDALRRQMLTGHIALSVQSLCDRTNALMPSFGKQLAYTPLWHGSLALAWQNPWVSIAFNGAFSGERFASDAHLPETRLAPYFDGGISLYRTFRLPKARLLNLRVVMQNALNASYEIITRYPMPGRAIYVETKLQF